MADYTTNFNLIKPAATDFYNVEDFNNNADIIDAALMNVSQSAGGFKKLEDCSSGDLLTYLSGMTSGEVGSFMSYSCTNQPDSNDYWKVTVLYNVGATTEEHNMSVIAIGTNSKTYTNIMINGSWNGWKKLYSTAESLNADTLNGYRAASFSQVGQVHLAGQGLYNGYSFENEGSNDTGMFSESEDDLKLTIGGVNAMYSYNGRFVFPNGTVYVQEAQPTAPDNSLWAW